MISLTTIENECLQSRIRKMKDALRDAELLEHTQGDCAVIPLEYWNKIKQLIKGEMV